MCTNLRRYILWKIVVGIVLVFLVITVNFYLLEVLPGDPTRTMLPRGGNSALRAQLIAEWGLDKPVLDRYVIYVTNIFTGDWGISTVFRPGMDVWDIMAPRQADTFVLLGLGVFLSAAIAMVVGPLFARRRGGWGDGLGSLLALLGFSLPAMFIAMTWIFLFAVAYPTFPAGGDASPNAPTLDAVGQLLDHAWHLVLPTLTLVTLLVGPFVLAARRWWTLEPMDPASGWVPQLFRATERTIPAIPLLWSWTICAVIIVEMMGNLSGLGSLLFMSTLMFDTPLLASLLLLLALISVGVVTVLDVLHAALAPRVGESVAGAPPPGPIELEDLGSTAKHTFLRPMGLLGLVLLLGILVITLEAAAFVGPYPTALDRFQPLLPTSPTHLLGTDRQGYDVLTLLVYGGGAPLLLAGEVFLVALALSLGLALTSGCLGRWADHGVSVGLDLLLVLPWIPFLGLFAIDLARQPLDPAGIVLFTLASWAIPARLLRASVLADVGSDPIRGAPWTPSVGVMVRRLWALRGKILGYAVMAAALSVVISSTLAFLGLLSSTPESWGQMISDSWTSLDLYRDRWYVFVPPGLAITALAYGLLLLAFALRESGHRAVRRERPIPMPEPMVPPAPGPLPPEPPAP